MKEIAHDGGDNKRFGESARAAWRGMVMRETKRWRYAGYITPNLLVLYPEYNRE